MSASAKEEVQQNDKRPRRACFVFFPNGVSLPSEKHEAHKDWHWFPHETGSEFSFTKSLQPLEPFRKDVSILQGLSHPLSRKIVGHNTADVFLTGADISKDYENSISVDQLIARETGKHTRFPSLVLSSNGGIGYTARTGTLSFNKSGLPIPAESQPRRIFDRLFGRLEGVAKDQQRKELHNTGSLLDYLLQDSRRLQGKLGKRDQQKLDEYLTSVREVELQVQRTDAWLDIEKPSVDGSVLALDAEKSNPEEYIRTIYDLMFLAFQTDATRVATYQIAREDGRGIGDKFPQALGLSGHHGLSHSGGKPGGFEKWGRYDQFLAAQLAYFLEKLKSCQEGDGTLLDRTMITYGCGTSTTHNARNYPIIVAGGNACGLKHGGHHQFGEETPFANTLLTVAQAMKLPAESFADSTGVLSELA